MSGPPAGAPGRAVAAVLAVMLGAGCIEDRGPVGDPSAEGDADGPAAPAGDAGPRPADARPGSDGCVGRDDCAAGRDAAVDGALGRDGAPPADASPRLPDARAASDAAPDACADCDAPDARAASDAAPDACADCDAPDARADACPDCDASSCPDCDAAPDARTDACPDCDASPDARPDRDDAGDACSDCDAATDACVGAPCVADGGEDAGAACLHGALAPCPRGACPTGLRRCIAGAWGRCEAAAELCNGFDDDCDGAADEDFPHLGEPCSFGSLTCASRGVLACDYAQEYLFCEGVPERFREVCNAIDDDCDRRVDVDLTHAHVEETCYDGPPETRGRGRCRAGRRRCTRGVFGACELQITPRDERCNGEDDDCDDRVDEAPTGGPLTTPCDGAPAEAGLCRAGWQTCVRGRWGECEGAVSAAPEACGAGDADCDGAADEGLACACAPGEVRACDRAPPGRAGVGACVTGRRTCREDGGGWTPCEGAVEPAPEVCNGEDDDCDGETDEVAGLGTQCRSGVGACQASGALRCGEDPSPVCDVRGDVPAEETCNGRDDDCDGVTDEVAGLGEPCVEGRGLCRGHGVTACIFGQLVCDRGAADPDDEVCNGLDDDCDGNADEAFDDTDGDGRADCRDTDDDGDGVTDDCDVCPEVADPGQADADGDGVGDACVGRAVVDVASTERSSCMLVADGRTVCWGFGPPAVLRPPPGPLVALDAGAHHLCGLDRDGAVACWGDDAAGETRPPAGRFLAVEAGGEFSCALRPDGEVACWGRGDQGQAAPPPGPFTFLTAGARHACALRPDGEPVCWGAPEELEAWPPGERYARIAFSGCGVLVDGRRRCDGFGGPEGQPGDYLDIVATVSLSPRRPAWQALTAERRGEWATIGSLTTEQHLTGLAPGADRVCGIRRGRPPVCRWTGTPQGFEQVPAAPFVDVVRGGAGLRADGRLVTRGRSELDGRYARPSPSGDACAIRLDGALDCGRGNVREGRFVELQRSASFTCALAEDDRLTCWDRAMREAPPTGEPARTFALGSEAVCAVRPDGTLRCWNDQFWDPPPAGRFEALALAARFGCALDAGGAMTCWGVPSATPDGWPEERFRTVAAFGLLGFAEVVCGVTVAGGVRCAGSSRGRPLALSIEGGFEAADAETLLGLRADGTVVSLETGLPVLEGRFTKVAGRCALRVDGALACTDGFVMPPAP